MPVIEDRSYKPGFWFRNGHVNTIFPYLLRQQPVAGYHRERIETPDQDFLDLDFIKNDHRRLAILCHGLEGNSSSQYMLGTAGLLASSAWDVLALNYRGCSGEENRRLKMYHSGYTEDLHHVISVVEKDYDKIALIGYSLGGNMVLKYLGDGKLDLSSKISAAVAVSVPCDLAASSLRISKWYNFLYEKRFITSLSKKLKLKHRRFPEKVNISRLKGLRRLMDVDNYFTGPMHGFKDAEDYYKQSNSLQFLHQIEIPSLIINALDDPFLPLECYPFKEARKSRKLFLITPEHGGHVGFTTVGQPYFWEENKILSFINDPDELRGLY